jgi:oxepin-CoA hydrolase/3-oxo-5,6-dehydrosuberyl-CoA semialdehyde dehydrogenase
MVLATSQIRNSLEILKDGTEPLFGKMTAQHMVEHLTITLKLSIGKIKYPPFTPSERALIAKQNLLFTELEMGMGMTPPNDTGELYPLKYPNLQKAKEALLQAWEENISYYEQNDGASEVHPRFGHLNKEEWDRFHYKHFMHHFKQFGIWVSNNKLI